MTQAEILAWVAGDLVHRTDQTTAIGTGLTLAHRAIQRDPIVLASGNTVPADWYCQETRTAAAFTYASTDTAGVALPTDCKRPLVLYTYDATTGGLSWMSPTSGGYDEGTKRWNAERTAAGLDTAGVQRRWFVRNGKLWLTHPPATGGAALSLKLDYRRWLPYYSAQVLTDWFSENAAEALGYASAFNVFVGIEAYDQAKAMRDLYTTAVRSGWSLDRDQREGGSGGSSGVHRPDRWPTPGYR